MIPTIRAISTSEGRGATVQRVIGTQQLYDLDPFVMLDDFSVNQPAGFPDHPHRGFEAFTYMVTGSFHHKDNLGNDSHIGAGGTQRFTSGRGARHSEMPGEKGPNQGLQLWVNLPRRLKQMTPSYGGHDANALPVREVNGALVRTVVGPSSPVELQTPVRYLDIVLAKGATFADELEEGWNSMIYVLEGAIRANGTAVAMREAGFPDAGPLALVADESSRFVLLTGKPHGEPIIHRGPFVD